MQNLRLVALLMFALILPVRSVAAQEVVTGCRLDSVWKRWRTVVGT